MKAVLMTTLCMSLLSVIAACDVTSIGLADDKTETIDAAVILPDADATALAALGGRVLARVRDMVPDPVLRQVDINYRDGLHFFRFTDRSATQAITVTISDPLEPADEWEVHTGLSPLVGHQQPSIDLGSLRVGPARVVKAATEHWTECGVRGLGVTGVRDQLKWNIFCNLPEGVVSATVDGVTGEFVPSSAPPARVPPTATPERRRKR